MGAVCPPSHYWWAAWEGHRLQKRSPGTSRQAHATSASQGRSHTHRPAFPRLPCHLQLPQQQPQSQGVVNILAPCEPGQSGEGAAAQEEEVWVESPAVPCEEAKVIPLPSWCGLRVSVHP